MDVEDEGGDSFMSKRFMARCVAVALMLATADIAAAAAGTTDGSAEGGPNDLPVPLGIQFDVTDNALGGAAAGVTSSSVSTTLGSATVADTTPAAIPLPAGVYVGLVGLASTFAAWRRFKRRRL